VVSLLLTSGYLRLASACIYKNTKEYWKMGDLEREEAPFVHLQWNTPEQWLVLLALGDAISCLGEIGVGVITDPKDLLE